ncbi:MAG TPA: methionine biosynthesis protein MetW [Anaerolineae bacterium]|nr:methionine biosynthesis protein MetW [Anaerolineae bacterium]
MRRATKRQETKRRLDYALIQALVPHSSRVLDLGCGDGQLLAELAANKGCEGRGIEINDQAVLACIQRGVAVYHGDMLEGMRYYRDDSFDVVILSQTLQQASDPVRVIVEMLRVGDTAIISFPNFGYWEVRLQLLLRGRMPKNDLLPYEWYDTPNVHLCTVTDFRELCEAQGLRRMREIFLVPPSRQIGALGANWRAGLAIFQIARKQEV